MNYDRSAPEIVSIWFFSDLKHKGADVERDSARSYSIFLRSSSFFPSPFLFFEFLFIFMRSSIANRIADAAEVLNLSLCEAVALGWLYKRLQPKIDSKTCHWPLGIWLSSVCSNHQ